MLKQQREESDPDPARLSPSCQPAAQETPTAEQVPEKPPRFTLWVLSPGAKNPPGFGILETARALQGVHALCFTADKALFILPVYKGGFFNLSSENCLISTI